MRVPIDNATSDNSPQVLSPEQRKRKLLELLMAKGMPERQPMEQLPGVFDPNEPDDDFTVAQPVPMASNEMLEGGGLDIREPHIMAVDPIEQQLAKKRRKPLV